MEYMITKFLYFPILKRIYTKNISDNVFFLNNNLYYVKDPSFIKITYPKTDKKKNIMKKSI